LISLSRENRPWFFLLLALTALALIVMLYYGIRLKGFRPSNNVQWSASEIGLTFGRYAQAYTDGFYTGTRSGTGLTVELAIQPEYLKRPGIGMLIAVQGDDSQLVICQWQSSLIIMNGNDYSNRRKTPKIYFKLDTSSRESYLITITSNKSGTRLFMDGALKKSNKELILRYPDGTAQTRLVVANSLSGRNPWVGTLMGLAFYDHALENDTILRHFQIWRTKRNFKTFKRHEPRLLYVFDEGQGNRVYNQCGDGLDLIIPDWIKVLQVNTPSWPQWEELERPSALKDALINFAGFMPLGFLIVATLCRLEGIRIRWTVLIALLSSFVFSIGIEIAQMWIPSRHSSMLDLTLNTLGGGMGALLYPMFGYRAGH
jgi:VanZ family protein